MSSFSTPCLFTQIYANTNAARLKFRNPAEVGWSQDGRAANFAFVKQVVQFEATVSWVDLTESILVNGKENSL